MPAPSASRSRLDAHFQADIGVIVSDSAGRPWRLGTVGIAIGAAGVPSLWDRRGEKDLSGRPLEVTEVALRRCGGGHGRAGNGRGRRGATRGTGARARLDAPRSARRRTWSGPRPRTCSDERAGSRAGNYVVLSGGSGGVKLAVGMAQLLGERLAIVVNTGDDFIHLGLHVSPDVDTVLYSLAGVVNDETGWGRRGETWTFMRALGELGGPTWFRLGDGDLATHVDRTQRLRAGETLTAVGATSRRRRWGLRRASCP